MKPVVDTKDSLSQRDDDLTISSTASSVAARDLEERDDDSASPIGSLPVGANQLDDRDDDALDLGLSVSASVDVSVSAGLDVSTTVLYLVDYIT